MPNLVALVVAVIDDVVAATVAVAVAVYLIFPTAKKTHWKNFGRAWWRYKFNV